MNSEMAYYISHVPGQENVTSAFLFYKAYLADGRFRVRSFGMIRKRITDPISLGSRCIKGTD